MSARMPYGRAYLDPTVPATVCKVLGRTLYVGGVRASVTEAQLQERFSEYGGVAEIQINRVNDTALLTMGSHAEAYAAREAMRTEATLRNGMPIKVGWRCAFGPKSAFNFHLGISTIELSVLTPDDRHALTATPAGGFGPAVAVVGGAVVEEPGTAVYRNEAATLQYTAHAPLDRQPPVASLSLQTHATGPGWPPRMPLASPPPPPDFASLSDARNVKDAGHHSFYRGNSRGRGFHGHRAHGERRHSQHPPPPPPPPANLFNEQNISHAATPLYSPNNHTPSGPPPPHFHQQLQADRPPYAPPRYGPGARPPRRPRSRSPARSRSRSPDSRQRPRLNQDHGWPRQTADGRTVDEFGRDL
ncbi:hypothetical protein THASP1DRAFT_29197 [Thamnocephalis sphaerospora]|uniref:RRM domain-containing protein n=1 Tax=Thamnocephalis sphaerospora TaxID=78915 RepID=A0A4P9XSB9_9FUNG|nr:hypothetical protein THASP1DRAFT_29197 [Thamnocephalis sphaerospora]|eukprot:RKP09006.1 hypothetical protein THASP1DRAFT_29197 [Thamnocephalis sphaerospora]